MLQHNPSPLVQRAMAERDELRSDVRFWRGMFFILAGGVGLFSAFGILKALFF